MRTEGGKRKKQRQREGGREKSRRERESFEQARVLWRGGVEEKRKKRK